MQRDLLLLGEMIHAAERAHQLANGLTLEDLQADQLRSESLLWNFTVLGEAAAQLPGDVKDRFPNVPWQQPARLRNRIVHGYWSIDLENPAHHRDQPAARLREPARSSLRQRHQPGDHVVAERLGSELTREP